MELDEKVCPYCAEVVKAAAVKCRYCHSDLPVAAVPPRPNGSGGNDDETPSPAHPAESVEQTAQPPADEGTGLFADRVAVLLAALSAVLLVAVVLLGLGARPDELRTADNGQVTAPAYRTAALGAAEDNVTTILSYGYKTLEQDAAAAREVLTEEYYEDDYRAPMADRIEAITRSKLTQSAAVASSSLISLTRDRATVMLLSNIVNVPEDASAAPPQTLSRLLVRMVREDDRWIVSELTGF